ncbi:Jacalin-like lectin domain [Phytophthora cactorum]|nr:Jacalin-like lectin domain [Phytophthora cactorum]
MALRHGKRAGNTSELVLGAKEYITSMEAHWGTVLRRTQIVYLGFNTSEGNSISVGSKTKSKSTVRAPKGFQLGGFFGLSDKTIVKMGAIWTRISTKVSATATSIKLAASASSDASESSSAAVSDESSASELLSFSESASGPIQLSESFGGPHGKKFSDQASVVAGQTIGTTAVTFNHGRAAGKKNTLTLAKDEYITSMEAHWAEKKGNTVSGGSQTERKNTVTAPEGFQLGASSDRMETRLTS